MRWNRLLLPFVVVSTILLGSCSDPAPNDPEDQAPAETTFMDAAPGLSVISGDSGGSMQASQSVFTDAPLAVVSRAGEAGEMMAARAAVALGIPMFVDINDAGGLARELERLGVEQLLAVGPAGELPDGPWEVIDVEADPEALNTATGLEFGGSADGDPAAAVAEIAHLEPGFAPQMEPGATSSGRTIRELQRGAPPQGTAALAVEDSKNLAAVATLRAAGVPVIVVDEPNLHKSSEAIEFLHEAQAGSILAIGEDFADAPELEWQVQSAQTGYQLPGGGQEIFGSRHYVALYGTPGSPELGALGHQDLDEAVARVHKFSEEYQDLTEYVVVSSFEIIATVASEFPGKDGDYSYEIPADELRPWVERAGEEGMLVILDLQPGRTDFLTQAKLYEDLLELPHVGLALDPEWRLKSGQVHLVQIGTVSAAEINEVITWLADVVNERGLPPKMLVLHQFRLSMISDRQDVDLSRPEVEVLIHADGQGGQGAKQDTWRALHVDAPDGLAWGWKNFYEKDSPMLTPKQTIQGVSPVPDLITYQ